MKTTKYDAEHICCHCLEYYGEHADNKCLYEPTRFTPVECIACQRTNDYPSTTAVVDDVRYFLCTRCDYAYTRMRLIPSPVNEPVKYKFMKTFLSNDILIRDWRRGLMLDDV